MATSDGEEIGIENLVTLIEEVVEIRSDIGCTIVQRIVGEGDQNACDDGIINTLGRRFLTHVGSRKCFAHNLSEYRRGLWLKSRDDVMGC